MAEIGIERKPRRTALRIVVLLLVLALIAAATWYVLYYEPTQAAEETRDVVEPAPADRQGARTTPAPLPPADTAPLDTAAAERLPSP